MGITVTKFGGTSLADAGQFKKIKEIIQADPSRRYVVASAPGKRYSGDVKVTDLLLQCYAHAMQGDDFDEELRQIQTRFADICQGIGVDFPLEEEIDKIRTNLKEDPNRDYTASRGEYLNSRILAAYLGFTFVDPEWCICFDEKGAPDNAMTKRTLGAALHPLEHAVVAGFYGADPFGRIRTFSRGGSDVTGSLVAAAVKADLYENWTDVSGLLAADPHIVEAAGTVDYISYRELRTLSYMGASVLHTDAVLPSAELSIPINIRNTNRPEDAGTMIVRKIPSGEKKDPVVGVAGRKGMTVLQVEKVMVSDGAGFSAVLLDLLKERSLPFEQCLTGIDTVTLVIRSDLFAPCRESLIAQMREVLRPDYIGIRDKLSMIAIVGEKDTEASDANVKMLAALSQAGIEITTVNQGAGKLNLLIGVPEEKYEDAVRTVYQAMEEL